MSDVSKRYVYAMMGTDVWLIASGLYLVIWFIHGILKATLRISASILLHLSYLLSSTKCVFYDNGQDLI